MNNNMIQDMTQDMNCKIITRKMKNFTRGLSLCDKMMTIRNGRFLRNLLFLTLMMVIGATNEAWGQEPVEITTDDNNNGIIEDSEKKLYLIQTNQFQSFYMIPQNDKVTTVNLPNDQMLWYFEDAGTENNIQYYYIVSNRNSTKKYICNTNKSNRTIDLVEKTSSNEEACKFKLVADNSNGTEGYYNIDTKATQTNYALNKQAGSVSSQNPIRTTGDSYVHDYSSKWKFIRYNGTVSWPNPPFTPSTDEDKHYYKIHNIVNGSYYVSTDSSTPINVTFASTTSDNMIWYFKEVPADPTDASTQWFKYYYIVNPEASDQYMYYQGTATDGSDQTNAVILKSKSSENEDRYQFIVVQAARTVKIKNVDTPVECYTIIPKLLRDQLWNKSNSIGTNSVADGNTLGIIKGRVSDATGNNNSHWEFQTTSYNPTVVDPVITYNPATNQVSITCATSGATIYYTTNGEDPTISDASYSSAFTLSAGVTTIKAIAKKGGIVTTTPVTYNVVVQTTVGSDARPYLIQSQEFNYYYLVPSTVTSEDADGYHKMTTNSLPRPSMAWLFEDAGIADGKQYYYIVNQSTGQYIYYHTYEKDNSTSYSISCSDIDLDFSTIVDKDPYKFSIDVNTNGGYNIKPMSSSTRCINKNGGNLKNWSVNASTGVNNAYARWSIIPHSGTVPNTAAPITVSTNENKQYYSIASESEPTYFIVTPTSPATAVTTTTTQSEGTIWYFEEATHDDWLTYYYIRNAATNEYLYQKTSNSEAIAMGTTPTNDSYKFALANSTTGAFYIVPYSLRYNATREYYSLFRDGDNPLKITKRRWYNDTSGNDNAIKWIFTEATLQCANPEITYSAGDNGYVITSPTSDAQIYYRINGTPELTSAYLYSTAIPMSSLQAGDVIHAIAARNADATTQSEEATLTIVQVATPAIQDNGNNAIVITCSTPEATIYYTTDGSDPKTSETKAVYSTPLIDVSGKVIKAIAVMGGFIDSDVATSGTIMFACATPVIKKNDQNSFTITCSNPAEGVTIYYTLADKATLTDEAFIANPVSTGIAYPGSAVTTTFPQTIRAIATADGYSNSAIAEKTIGLGLNGTGTTADPYEIDSDSDFETFIEMVNDNGTANPDYVDCAAAYYKLTNNISASGSDPITTPFTGEFDGGLYTISGLDHALFNTVNGGKVKNVILDGVSISGGTDAGAIANVVTGTSTQIASIYNCGILSGSVSGSGNVGSLVGQLGSSSDNAQCYARVINCYSYATVSGEGTTGGIVGYNCYASKSGDIRSMVMNCMFYGTGEGIYPIYGGQEISNEEASKLNNYNYFSFEKLPTDNIITVNNNHVYNRALAAEDRYLKRFEFYRLLLNSNRELAAWYAIGDVTKGKGEGNEMAKWVLDKSIAEYPILKAQGKYTSIINYDDTKNSLGTNLSVTISGVGSNAPSGAVIIKGSLTLDRTGKDPDNYNFNYDKVQLPYYNDVGTGNYTSYKVVTGWKITGMTGGNQGTFTAADQWNGYNFADRSTYAKDLYSQSERVFSQGAYFDVPDGVTGITIEPYWADCVYLSDTNYDSWGYETNSGVTDFGERYASGTSFNGQTVHSTLTAAINALGSGTTVYDNAIVLVGNCHQQGTKDLPTSKPFTITSVDQDADNEPDYCLIINSGKNEKIPQIRFDFISVPGVAMAHKLTSTTAMGILGNSTPMGWFEVTNTAVIRFSQLEYDWASKADSPLILLGGVVEQIVSTNITGSTPTHTKYIHVGSNVWFKLFNNGIHMDKTEATPHRPISVTGGQYESFYLSGYFRPDATPYSTEDGGQNAECYICGGKFGEVAGAGQEQISGDVRWQINYADIDYFYGGGINEKKSIQGDITVNIMNSKVGLYCGGPKFGNMNSNKTVTTTAENTEFGTFYGAGYGGTAYVRVNSFNKFNSLNYDWNGTSENVKITPQFTESNGNHKRGKYNSNYGISVNYEYENFEGSTINTVGRLYINYASLSLAQTNNVISYLTGCTITKNFYGGGNLGKVTGNITSTLNNCIVTGDIFGAGFSATVPTVDVFKNEGFKTPPYYNPNTGVFEPGVFPDAEEFTWSKTKGSNSNTLIVDTEGKWIHTDVDLTTLGTVTGNVTLNIIGNETNITGDVYGGGALASSNTNYYADSPVLTTSTTVNLIGGKITGDVYGGGLGQLEAEATATEEAKAAIPAYVGNTKVNLNGMDATEYASNTTLYSTWGLVQAEENGPYIVASNKKGCIVTGSNHGRIFGCNNLNGTPKGSVTVHVYGTQNAGTSQIANDDNVGNAKVMGTYDVTAVYGGANLSEYEPTKALSTDEEVKASAYAEVIIDGCDRTSIKQVYGGGNAASVPASSVTVNGTFEIEEVFGGGNGKDKITINGVEKDNPGANVGFRDYSAVEDTYNTKELRQETAFITNYVYGTGKAAVNIYGGTIHRVFGGSNTKGNVRQTAVTMLEDKSECEFCVDEAYGGGKSAPMDAEAILHMACIPGLKRAFGGAEEADIMGDVELNITNGTFDQVFGGNNLSGTIRGSITVNVEERGCKPVIIGELYGGGNEAAYSVWGYKPVTDNNSVITGWEPRESATDDGDNLTTPYADPKVNVKSFTSIGTVYGGGLGQGAKMVGNPTVNINVALGKHYNADASVIGDNFKTTGGYPVPSHEKGKMGAINNVFGGGNAAPVHGNTTVNIGTEDTVDYVTKAEGESSPLTGDTVMGADIRGNVYGGGNEAEVTGDTNVFIGKEAVTNDNNNNNNNNNSNP